MTWVLAVLLVACGGDDAADEGATATDAAEVTSTTEVDDETTTSTTDDDEDTTTTGAASATTSDDVNLAWDATAVPHRAEPNGTLREYDCPPGGSEHPIWGTGIYTDDSSVCTAAVHSGLITFEDGGTVMIAIEGPQESYEASTRFGVTSLEYPAWEGSFSVVSTE